MKKVYICAYTEQNLGDDMFITYLCNRYPNVQFYLICQECYATAFAKISNLTVIESKDSITDVELTLQIIIGGSIFMQSANKGILEKYLSSKEMLFPHLPTYIIGANFGPYESEQFYKLYKDWFARMDKIVFRDQYSYNLFKLNNMSWAPDILFNYKLPKPKSKHIIVVSCIKKNKRTGLDNYNESLYYQKLVEILNQYSSLGFYIILACFSVPQEDDISAHTIYNMLSPNSQLVTRILVYNGNISEFLNIFLSAEYIIGTRFHSVILGWNFSIPTFPICYNDKLRNAICSYGFKGKYANISKINNLDFSYIDFNRTIDIQLDIHNLKEKSNNQFLLIDRQLKE